MHSYRISKYDPALREADGRYLKEDWTSVSDIGRTFGGVTLLASDYSRVEDAYVEAIKCMLASAGVQELIVQGLETHDAGKLHPDLPELKVVPSRNGERLQLGCDLEDALRAGLRELAWYRLVSPTGFFVHFGYDYYLYAGGPMLTALPELPSGVFAEPFESPYHPEVDERK